MPEDVTLDEVARKSGVSRATASRALNGRDGVRQDVRTRVEMIAKALNYRPNRAAQNLAGGRASVIGLVLGSDELSGDLYASSLVQSVAAAANELDEGLMLLLDSKNPSEAVRKLLSDGLVDGVIVSAVALREHWVEQLLNARVPTVLIGSHPERFDVHVVDVENRESSALLVGGLLDSGCARVAMLAGPSTRPDAVGRLEGYHLAHERRGIVPSPGLLVQGTFSRRSGYERSADLLDLGVDAIFAANDEMAAGTLRRMTERGLRAPDDVSVAGFDGTVVIETSDDGLTTIEQPFAAIAERAVASLVQLVAGEEAPLLQLVEPQIKWGGTTRRSAETAPCAGGRS